MWPGRTSGATPTESPPPASPPPIPSQRWSTRSSSCGPWATATPASTTTPPEGALDCGALTNGEYVLLTSQPFSRAHVAYVSYYSLETTVSGSRQTLAQRLEEARFFTETQLNAAKDLVNSQRVY